MVGPGVSGFIGPGVPGVPAAAGARAAGGSAAGLGVVAFEPIGDAAYIMDERIVRGLLERHLAISQGPVGVAHLDIGHRTVMQDGDRDSRWYWPGLLQQGRTGGNGTLWIRLGA